METEVLAVLVVGLAAVIVPVSLIAILKVGKVGLKE